MKKLRELFEFILDIVIGIKNSRKKSLLKKNIDLKNKYNGERMHILLTGNSVKYINPNLLSDEYVMAGGFFVLHPEFDKFNVNFYVDAEPWGFKYCYLEKWLFNLVFNKTDNGAKIILHASSHEYVKDLISFREQDTYYVSSRSVFTNADDIKIEMSNYCNVLRGSFSFIVSMAIYMGFKEIYLIGADYTKIPIVAGHFYDRESTIVEPSKELVKMHSAINEFAQSNGVSIFNVVNNEFKSRTFRSIDFDSYNSMLINSDNSKKLHV